MSLLLATFVGVVGFHPQGDMPPQILPRVVCDDTQMTIIKDPELDLGLAVITPDEQFLYLSDHVTRTTIPNYWTQNEVSFRANELYSVDYDSKTGIPTLIKIFEDAGAYEFVFSDNLHTEITNSISLWYTVTYLGKDHPDCP